jgi:hypothetical protein
MYELLSGWRTSPKGNDTCSQAGFKNAYNITDGVEGDVVKDSGSVFLGQRMLNGWKNSGLPWTYHIDPVRVVLPEAK